MDVDVLGSGPRLGLDEERLVADLVEGEGVLLTYRPPDLGTGN